MVRMARVVVTRLTRNYNHDGLDRLVAASDPDRADTYTHDANGNLIDDGDHRYTYSARNRLVQVDNGDTAQYRYNALGQRIHKQAGSNVDYAALAAEYQQLADDLAAEATALSEQEFRGQYTDLAGSALYPYKLQSDIL